MAVVQFGIENYTPKPWRYMMVASIFLTPVVLVCALLCCCTEDYDVEPPVVAQKPTKKVS